MAYFGLNGITANEKDDMRRLIMDGSPWSENDKKAILEYCETDVVATARLLGVMLPTIDLPRALLRGKSMEAVSVIETNGVPIDVETLTDLQRYWKTIQSQLIAEVDKDFDVFDGTTFKMGWEQWLIQNQISWPKLPSGKLAMDDATFKDMTKNYLQISPIRELRATLGQMRLAFLAVGSDGRNRALLSPFKSVTGRNQPSNSRFIFGPATWMRSLIKPQKDYGLAYIDWNQQEFAIAEALSGDKLMQEAYCSGDPYLAFAKQAKAVPPDATKKSHKAARDQFKACVLAVQYGMGYEALARRIGQSPIYARQLLDLHKRTYSRFWEWSDACKHQALLHGKLWTVFGWYQHFGPGAKKVNVRSIRNFPMQANGAEMLRLACIGATEARIKVCAPVHDAILIEAPLNQLEETVRETQEIMRKASSAVLGGFELSTDAELVRYPGRYSDERGEKMWRIIWELLCKCRP